MSSPLFWAVLLVPWAVWPPRCDPCSLPRCEMHLRQACAELRRSGWKGVLRNSESPHVSWPSVT